MNEQVSHVLEGSFELVVEGTPHLLAPGGVLVIAPHARHAGRALTACRILDLWSPPRDDYR